VVIHRYAWEIPPFGEFDLWVKQICRNTDTLCQGILTLKNDSKNEVIRAYVFVLTNDTLSNRKLKQIDKLIYEL
jgi:hypothetical protein